MTYSIRDSRTPTVKEAVFPEVKDAIKQAMKSGMDVYLHSKDCDPEGPLGPNCPCKPARIPSYKQ